MADEHSIGVDEGSSDRTVYVAGIWREDSPWEVLGVFESAELAEAACTERNHFYGPMVLNRRMPDETVEWVGLTWPKWGS